MRFEKPEVTSSPFAYNSVELAVDVGVNIFAARTKKGWTQLKLAQKMETLQPAIARVECGNALPSLDFLLRIAKSLGTGLVAPTFESITADKFIPATDVAPKVRASADEFILSPLHVETFLLSPINTGVLTN